MRRWARSPRPALRARVTVGLALLVLLAAPAPAQEPAPARPATWAQPWTVVGAPNLHRIDDHLYRSAQPTARGMRNLEQAGLRKVINLRSNHSDSGAILGTRLGLEEVPMVAWSVNEEAVVRVLRVLSDPSQGPFLVHCQHGADRTGLVAAMYRMVLQGWSREEAMREMTEGGFGYHSMWTNLLTYLRTVDVDRIREKVLGGTVQVPKPTATSSSAGPHPISTSAPAPTVGPGGRALRP